MLQLKASGTTFEISDDKWCVVTMLLQDKVFRLGADLRRIVITRLCDALSRPEQLEESGKVKGVTYYWCLTLSENHASIYISEAARDHSRRICIQDAQGSVIHQFQLSKRDLQEWIDILSES